MVAGLFDSSMWEMASVGYIWVCRGMQRGQRHPTQNKTKQNNKTRNGGRTETGEEQRERESSIREQVQGREGRLNGEKSDQGDNHAKKLPDDISVRQDEFIRTWK